MNTASIESKSTTLGCTAANGEYVGIGECARLTGLSQQTVRRMNGELPHYVTRGGTRKYRLSDIKTYVDPNWQDDEKENGKQSVWGQTLFFVFRAIRDSSVRRSFPSCELFAMSRSTRRVRLLTLSGRPNPKGPASSRSVAVVRRRASHAATARAM
jgi:hypothetical protein